MGQSIHKSTKSETSSKTNMEEILMNNCMHNLLNSGNETNKINVKNKESLHKAPQRHYKKSLKNSHINPKSILLFSEKLSENICSSYSRNPNSNLNIFSSCLNIKINSENKLVNFSDIYENLNSWVNGIIN